MQSFHYITLWSFAHFNCISTTNTFWSTSNNCSSTVDHDIKILAPVNWSGVINSLAQLPYFFKFIRDMPQQVRKYALNMFKSANSSPSTTLRSQAMPITAATLWNKERRSEKNSTSAAWFVNSIDSPCKLQQPTVHNRENMESRVRHQKYPFPQCNWKKGWGQGY